MSVMCPNCFSNTLDDQGICSACNYDPKNNREKYPLALPAGSILYGRYIIGKVLGQGGFGITYLAQDFQTKELVAIKEYFPDTMATRTNTITVTAFTGERGENFAYGRSSFLDEAKTMAEFSDNPNVAGVQLYFEENGTAYFVMEYIDGCSFQEYIQNHGGRLSWAETARIMFPVMNALAEIHENGIIHRDVTPDNIYISKNGTVKLLDFGAARHSLGNVSRSLDVILKHGFAPKEQYSRRGRQGPYTDVYAVSATIYYAITGIKPDDAIERADEDNTPLPSQIGAKISQPLEDALMKGLAVKAEDRYQNMGELYTALTSLKSVESSSKQAAPQKENVTEYLDTVKIDSTRVKKLIVAVGVLVLVLGFFLLHTHNYGEWEIKEVPTCTLSGVQVRRCFCGKTESEQLPCLGHNYGDWEIVRQATCTGPGSRERACACGKTEVDIIPILDHQIVIDQKKDATCTEKGMTEGSHCSLCGFVLKSQDTISALGHNFEANDCTRCDAKKWWVEFTTTKTDFKVGERIEIHYVFRCNITTNREINIYGLPALNLNPPNQVVAYYRTDYKYPDGRVDTGTTISFKDGNAVDEDSYWYASWDNGIQNPCTVILYFYDENNYLLGSYTFTVSR